MERLMLKPREAAEAIGVGRTQFYKLVKAKIIPSCKVGNSIRIPVAALRAWIEAQAAVVPDRKNL
jgi:excisionase family DNA binding protein